MIIPAIRFIFLFLLVKKLITDLLFALEIIANNKRGVAIPIPNTKKFRRFNTKSVVVVVSTCILMLYSQLWTLCDFFSM